MTPGLRVLVFVLACGIFAPCLPCAGELPRVTSENGVLRDASGRQVLLAGVNYGKKNAPYLPDRGEEAYSALAQWGMNCVRLYVNWAAIEPQPGAYDEAFLARLDEQIEWANTHGLYVVLDLHQDLYSSAIPGGNGAPAWATLDDDQPHIKGPGPWGVAYFTSPMVHRAFDNFWANQQGPGGVGLQDRYAAMAAHLGARYAENPGVLGIDLMNEPALGSDVTQVLPALIAAAPRLAALPDPPQNLAASLMEGDLSALTALTEREDIYQIAVEAITPLLQAFEREKLQPFYDRVGQAIRKRAAYPALFFEPAVLANSGAESALRPLQDEAGRALPNQVYAPHIYDLVTDTDQVHAPSAMRLEFMFANVAKHARTLGLPVVVGEWGAYYGNSEARVAAREMATLFETHGFGHLYWDYESRLQDAAYFDQLVQPRPVVIAGTLVRSRFDQEAKSLTLTWNESAGGAGPSLIHLPRNWYMTQPELAIDETNGAAWRESEGGWWLELLHQGAGERTMVVRPSSN